MPGDDGATPGTWPIVRYSDPLRASRFLCDVLGFEHAATTVDEHHVVVLEELRWSEGDGVLVVGSHLLTQAASPSEDAVSATHLVSPDVDAIHRRVLASDAEVLSPPTDPTRLTGWRRAASAERRALLVDGGILPAQVVGVHDRGRGAHSSYVCDDHVDDVGGTAGAGSGLHTRSTSCRVHVVSGCACR